MSYLHCCYYGYVFSLSIQNNHKCFWSLINNRRQFLMNAKRISTTNRSLFNFLNMLVLLQNLDFHFMHPFLCICSIERCVQANKPKEFGVKSRTCEATPRIFVTYVYYTENCVIVQQRHPKARTLCPDI